MRKFKVFVSFPTKGLDKDSARNYIDLNKDAIMVALSDKVLILPNWRVKSVDDISFVHCLDLDQKPPESVVYDRLWHWGVDYMEIATCDAVVFMPGWDFAMGCRKELDMCIDIGIPYVII